MKNELTVQKTNLPAPTEKEFQQIMTICHQLGTCPFYAKLGTGGVLAVWLTARELGLPVMMCLNGGLYTFDGKVSLSAQLMNMMIVNAGHYIKIIKLEDDECELEFIRTDREVDNTFRYKFTREMAVKAGYFGQQGQNGVWLKKPKDKWVNYPRDMNFSRALSGGARKFMPYVIM